MREAADVPRIGSRVNNRKVRYDGTNRSAAL
jgi:hypothetical protein